MNPKELIIGYLETIPNKKCTALGLAILFQHYNMSKDLTAELLYEMYIEGSVLVIENVENPYLCEIKLIPKLRLV